MTCVTFDKSSPSYPSALLPTSAVPSSIRTPPGQFFHRQSQYQHKCLPLSWEMLSNWGDWEEAGEKSGRGVAFTCLCFFICFFHLSCLPNSLPLSLSLSHTHTHTHTHTCVSALFHSERHTHTSRVSLLGWNPKSSLIWNSLCICLLAEPTNSSVGVFIVSTKKNCHTTNKVFLIVVTVGKGKRLGRLTAWKAALCSKNIFDTIATAPEWLSTSPCDLHPLCPSLIGPQTHKNIQVSCWASESFQVISR